MVNSNNLDTQTTNTALAAYLYMQGQNLLKVETDRYLSVFIFEKNDTIEIDIRNYETGKAVGSLLVFMECYRKCLKMVKGKSW